MHTHTVYRTWRQPLIYKRLAVNMTWSANSISITSLHTKWTLWEMRFVAIFSIPFESIKKQEGKCIWSWSYNQTETANKYTNNTFSFAGIQCRMWHLCMSVSVNWLPTKFSSEKSVIHYEIFFLNLDLSHLWNLLSKSSSIQHSRWTFFAQ